MSSIVVVGGGISGLSAAYYLSKLPKDIVKKVIILERSSNLGGWIQSVRKEDGAVYEKGPRSIRGRKDGPGKNILEMVEDIGLTDKIISVAKNHVATTNRYLFINNKMYSLPNSMMQIIRKTPPFKQSLFSSIWKEPFKFNRLTNDCSIHEFISKRFSRDLADNAIDPFCRGVFGGDSKSLSAKACFPDMFKYQLQHGSIFLGSILGRKKPYDSESPLVNRFIKENWATWNMENGLQTLIEGLEKKLQAEDIHIFTGKACKSVEFNDGKVKVSWDKGQISADHVVFSTFSSDVSKVLQREQEELAKELQKIDAVTVGVSTIEYKGDVFPSQYRGFGHLIPSWESSAKNLGIVYESCIFPEHDNKERPTTRLTVMSGGAWFDKVFGKTHTQGNSRIEEESIKSVRQQLGIKDEPMRVETNVHKDCLPQFKVGHCDIVNKVEELSSNLPVSFIGSSFRGVSVLDCIWDAKLQVENLKNKLISKEV